MNDEPLQLEGPFDDAGLAKALVTLESWWRGDSKSFRDLRSVVVELAQNIKRHAEAGQGRLELSREGDSIFVRSASVALPEVAASVHEALESLGKLNQEALRSLRCERLRSPRTSSGAGLGLIEICRQATDAPKCAVIPIANCRVELQIEVSLFSAMVQFSDIPATEVTPEVSFDPGACTLRFQGESFPENVADFYLPIFEWVREQVGEKRPVFLQLALDYINTSSTKALLDLLDMLENYHTEGGRTAVEWIATSETMLEAGEDLLSGLTLPQRLVDKTKDPWL